MELKDVILSTLAEMEESHETPKSESKVEPIQEKQEKYFKPAKEQESVSDHDISQAMTSLDSELIYLNSIRERLLVLFEGFQAPNNANIEAKIDMTLNFLEYILATIDERIHKIEKENSEPV